VRSDKAATKTKKDGSPDLRFMRREEHLAKLEPLLKKPRSVDELADALGVTTRAIYFLFDVLEERGLTVARLGPKAEGRYVLMAGAPA